MKAWSVIGVNFRHRELMFSKILKYKKDIEKELVETCVDIGIWDDSYKPKDVLDVLAGDDITVFVYKEEILGYKK